MYRVVEAFEDIYDRRHAYSVGDAYPREGLKVSKERMEELATDKNRRKRPLIAKVQKTEK